MGGNNKLDEFFGLHTSNVGAWDYIPCHRAMHISLEGVLAEFEEMCSQLHAKGVSLPCCSV